MTKLVMSQSVSDRLRQLSKTSAATTDDEQLPLVDLQNALSDQKDAANLVMTGSSAAVPTAASEATVRLVLEHTLLISVAKWASKALDSTTAAELRLYSLVKGSEVYVAAKPKFERSRQLEESLAAIKRAQEEAEYAMMATSGAPLFSVAKPFTITANSVFRAHTSIAGTDPTLPLDARIAAQFGANGTTSTKQQIAAEEEEWKSVQRQLGVILNIFLSVMATATAAWWASGSTNVTTKVLISLVVALITGIAEVVLYNRYQVYVSQSRKYGKKRMTGSDLRDTNFKPLNLSHDPRATSFATSG